MMSGQVSWFLDFICIFYNLNTPGRHVRRDISCTRWVTFPPIACIRPQIGVTNMNIDFYFTVFQYFKYLQIKFELSQENTINEINAQNIANLPRNAHIFNMRSHIQPLYHIKELGKKRIKKNTFCRVLSKNTRQREKTHGTKKCLPCALAKHTAKNNVCRVPLTDTRQRVDAVQSFWRPACLPCVWNMAHGKDTICRVPGIWHTAKNVLPCAHFSPWVQSFGTRQRWVLPCAR